MKKYLKIVFSMIIVIIILVIVDLIFIFNINRPLFAIKDKNELVYRGLLYDTYNCQEYSIPQIKAKGKKFNCILKNKVLVYSTAEVQM